MRRSALPIGILIALLAGCGDSGGGTPDANRTPDADTRGTISFSWTITDGSGPLTCDDIGANAVSITMLPVGVIGSSTDIANCGGGTLTTRPITARDYDVEINISSVEGELTDMPIKMSGITVSSLQDTPLGAVEFTVDPIGNLSFQITAQTAPAGNCATVADDGAEIVKFELSIEQDDTCVPVDFAIADENGDPVPPGYSVTCSGETYDSCIPENYTLSIADIGSGPTKLHITGYRTGDVPCYMATAQIDVPAHGLTADVGAITIPLDLTNSICNPDAPDAGV